MNSVYFVAVEDRLNVEDLQLADGRQVPVDQKELMELFLEREDSGDIQLLVDNAALRAHKAVLIAASDYFQAMFRSDFVEAAENEVTIVNFSLALVESFLKFVYTGEIHIDEDNFEQVLELANHFQVGALISLCVKISTQHLDWDTFAQHYSDAHDFMLQEHFEACHDFLATNFSDLLRNRLALRDIPPEALLSVLARDDLRVLSEDDLVEIVINWVKLDLAQREPALPHILDQIRLPFVSMRALRRLCDAFDGNPMLKMRTLRRVMTEAMKKHNTTGPTTAKPRSHYQTASTPFLNYDGEDVDED